MSYSTRVQHRSLSHSEVKLIKSLRLLKYRRRLGLFIAEGDKLIREMLPAYRCRLLVGEESLVESILIKSDIDRIAQAVILSDLRQTERVSGMKSPRPLIAICEIPEVQACATFTEPTLLLDDVQDPGNVGTLLRTCDWMGINQVICTNGCADTYSPKVLQATMGALARVRVFHCADRGELMNQLKSAGIPLIGAFIDGVPLRELEISPRQPYILILGNEGNGISPDLSALVSKRITIPSPTSDHCESLNMAIAGAIIMAHIML